jgi:hypothetical protein
VGSIPYDDFPKTFFSGSKCEKVGRGFKSRHQHFLSTVSGSKFEKVGHGFRSRHQHFFVNCNIDINSAARINMSGGRNNGRGGCGRGGGGGRGRGRGQNYTGSATVASKGLCALCTLLQLSKS